MKDEEACERARQLPFGRGSAAVAGQGWGWCGESRGGMSSLSGRWWVVWTAGGAVGCADQMSALGMPSGVVRAWRLV